MTQRTAVVTVEASAAHTATGNSVETSGWAGASTLRAQLNVTARAGTNTPTCDVILQDSLDGTTWNTVGTFTQVTTSTTREVKNITGPVGPWLRAAWTIAGTNPSYTFSVVVAAA